MVLGDVVSLCAYRSGVRSCEGVRSDEGDDDVIRSSEVEDSEIDLDLSLAFVMRKYGDRERFGEFGVEGLEELDLGRDDRVEYFGIVGTEYMIKYVRDDLLHVEDIQVDRDLVGSEFIRNSDLFTDILYVGTDYVLMDRVRGRSMYDLVGSGEFLNPGWVRKVSEGLVRLVEQCGLYGHRVSLHDVYVYEDDECGDVRLRVLDISHSRSEREDLVWCEVQRLYDRWYGRGILPLSWKRLYFRYVMSRLK